MHCNVLEIYCMCVQKEGTGRLDFVMRFFHFDTWVVNPEQHCALRISLQSKEKKDYIIIERSTRLS